MTVAELIEKLKALPQDATVINASNNFEHNGADVETKFVHLYENGEKRTQSFRDAFDGDSYQKTTYSIIGGDLPLVKIS